MNKPEVVWRVQNHEKMTAWDRRMRLIRSLGVSDTFAFGNRIPEHLIKMEPASFFWGVEEKPAQHVPVFLPA